MKLSPTRRLIARIALKMESPQLSRLLNLFTFPDGLKGAATSPVKFLTLLRQHCGSVREFVRTLDEMLSEQSSFADLQQVGRPLYGLCDDNDLNTSGIEFPKGLAQHRPLKEQKTAFNATLLKISDAIPHSKLEIMIVVTPIPDSKKESITYGHVLFNEMKQCGCISENDSEFLVDLLTELQLVNCLEILEDYKRRYPPIDYPPFRPQRPISHAQAVPAQPTHGGRWRDEGFQEGGVSSQQPSVVVGRNGYAQSLHGGGGGGHNPGSNSGGPSSNPNGSHNLGSDISPTSSHHFPLQEQLRNTGPSNGYRQGPIVATPPMQPQNYPHFQKSISMPYPSITSSPPVPPPAPPSRPLNGTQFGTHGLPGQPQATSPVVATPIGPEVNGSCEPEPSAPPRHLVPSHDDQCPPADVSVTPHVPHVEGGSVISGRQETATSPPSRTGSRRLRSAQHSEAAASGGGNPGSEGASVPARKKTKTSSQGRPSMLLPGESSRQHTSSTRGGFSSGRERSSTVSSSQERSLSSSLGSYRSPNMHSNMSSLSTNVGNSGQIVSPHQPQGINNHDPPHQGSHAPTGSNDSQRHTTSSYEGPGDAPFVVPVPAMGAPPKQFNEISGGGVDNFQANVEARPSSSIVRVQTSELLDPPQMSQEVSGGVRAVHPAPPRQGLDQRHAAGTFNLPSVRGQAEPLASALNRQDSHGVVLNKQQALSQAGAHGQFQSINQPVTSASLSASELNPALPGQLGEREESRHNSLSQSESGHEVVQCSDTQPHLYPALPPPSSLESSSSEDERQVRQHRKRRTASKSKQEGTQKRRKIEPSRGTGMLSSLASLLGFGKKKPKQESTAAEQESATSTRESATTSSGEAEEQEDDEYVSCEES